MATNVGRVGIVMKGAWSSSATYEVLDAVSYNNGLYIAKQAVPANTLPTNTTYWQKAIAEEYTSINCNDITSLNDLISLITLTSQVGQGNIGNTETSGLKSIIGQPFSYAYIGVFIRLIGKKGDALIYEAVATRENNGSGTMAKKYIWFNGNSRVPSQSTWEVINVET